MPHLCNVEQVRQRLPGLPPGALPAHTSAEAYEWCLIVDVLIKGDDDVGIDTHIKEATIGGVRQR